MKTGQDARSVAAGLIVAVAAGGSLLAACGQKGPLYIPGVERPEGGVVRFAVPASAPRAAASAAPAASDASGPR